MIAPTTIDIATSTSSDVANDYEAARNLAVEQYTISVHGTYLGTPSTDPGTFMWNELSNAASSATTIRESYVGV